LVGLMSVLVSQIKVCLLKGLPGILKKSACIVQHSPLGRGQRSAAESIDSLLNPLLQLDYLTLQRYRLAGTDGRLQRRNLSARGFFGRSFRLGTSGR